MQYWPDQTNTSVTRGKFDITVTSLVPSAEYQIRKIQLKSVSLYRNELPIFTSHFCAPKIGKHCEIAIVPNVTA